MKMSLVTVLLGFLVSTSTSAQTPAQTIPVFTFYKLDKTPFTNKDVTVGKETLFIFFDVTCEHCQHTLNTLSTRIKECKDLAIYLISLEDKTAITNFFNQYAKNLPGQKNVTILQDSKNQFITQFNPRKYPSVFLFSSQKKLLLYDDEDQDLEKFFKIITKTKK